MSDKTEQGLDALKQQLFLLPGALSHALLERIRQTLHYEPVIGIMGKTGAGCTREPLCFTLDMGGRRMTLVDLPGAGESLDYDREYQQLYQAQLPKLDLILWVMKADDRACAIDEMFHQFLLKCGVSPGSIVFVINQADKAEPSLEWDRQACQPSISQLLTLTARSAAVSGQFSTPYPVHAVSAHTGYNLNSLVETLIFALPPEASSGVFRQVREEHRTAEAECTARQDFGELLGELFSCVVDAFPLPKMIREGLGAIRDGIVKAATSLWHWFF